MSRIAKLYPTRIYRTQYNPVIENESNMFTGVDSDTYATVTTTTNYSNTLFVGGFNFSLVPSSAIISSFSIKMRVGRAGQNNINSGRNWIFNGTKEVSLTNSSSVTIYSQPTISVIDPTPLSFEDLRSYGDDFNLRVPVLSNSTTGVYGFEIDVDYELPKNKVVYFGQTLIDLTADTVTAERLTKGFTAHDASGALITGVATEGSTYQDEDGCVVLGEDESSSPQGNISITANGTYDVADYAGASVDLGGMSETQLRSYIQRSSAFTDIDWPDGMTTIGSYAFAYCTYFAPSSLPSEISRINEYAFYYCTRLALTSLPSSVTSIGQYAFRACANLALTSLPSGLTNIGNYAFQLCNKLALTDLPSGITSIGTAVFASCISLSTMDLSGVTSIGPNAFQNCTSLATVTLSSGLRNIDGYAFSGCSPLVVSTLPDSLTSIGTGAFSYCESITSISCEGTITTLGSSAFNGNVSHHMSLTSVSFPNMALTSTLGVVFGSTAADNACQLLEFCDLGSTIGIGANAFANCYALETLVLRKTASVCTLTASAFLNTPMHGYNNLTGKVYVPSALISAYQTAANWATLYNDGTVEFLAIEGSDYER